MDNVSETGKEGSQLVIELERTYKESEGLVTKIDQLRDMLQCVLRDEGLTKAEETPDEQLVERADRVRKVRQMIERGSSSITLLINCLEV